MKSNTLLAMMLLLLLGASGCKKHHQKPGIEVKIEWKYQGENVDGAPFVLSIYGANEIIMDTLMPNRKGKISFSDRMDRDTLDLILLHGPFSELLIPIFPTPTEEISVRFDGDSLYLQGMKYQESIQQYYSILKRNDGEVSEELVEFFNERVGEPITMLWVRDLLQRNPEIHFLDDFRRLEELSLRVSSDYARVIGAHQSILGGYTRKGFPISVSASGEKERLDLKKKLGKRPYWALTLLDVSEADSLELSSINKYFSRLDSLNLPSFNILIYMDSLPKGWKTQKTTNWRYFLLDSIGEASNFLEAYELGIPPKYLLVDSMMQIRKSWNVSDSLINYMKTYHQSKKEETNGD